MLKRITLQVMVLAVGLFPGRAEDANGLNDLNSEVALLSAATEPPAAPTNIVATPVSGGKINITWTDNATDEINYFVHYKLSSSPSFSVGNALPANSTSYQISGLLNNTSYDIRISLRNGNDITYADVITLNTLSEPLAAPTNIVATPVSGGKINITWTDNATDEINYFVHYKLSSSPSFSVGNALPANSTSYQISGLLNNTSYDIRISLRNGNDITYADVITLNTLSEPLAAPTNIVATPVSGGKINITWTDNATDEINYFVHYKLSSSPSFSVGNALPANSTSYQISGLLNNTSYDIRISLRNGNDITYADVITLNTLSEPLAAPTNIVATPVSGGKINITWTDNATNEINYYVYYKLSASTNYVVATNLPANSSSYQFTGLPNNTSYDIKIKVQNGNDITYSDVVTVNTLSEPPVAPTNIVATPVSGGKINLTWTDNATNEINYYVYYKQSSNTSYTATVGLSTNTTSYQLSGLLNNTSYDIKIKVQNGNDITYSDVVTINTLSEPPAAPTNIVATPVSGGKINLTWADNATNEINYYVYYKQSSNTSYTATVGLSTNTTSYQLSGLLNNTSYDIKIKVQNGNDITYSDVVTINTLSEPPAAPTNIVATPVSGGKINLTWTDNATNEINYYVYYKQSSNTSYTATVGLSTNTTSYQLSGLLNNTSYDIKIKVQNGNDITYSDVVTINTLSEPPAAPTNIVATPVSGGKINLTWADNATNEINYYVYYKQSSNTSYTATVGLSTNTTSYQLSGLLNNTSYDIKIKVQNGNDITYSDVVTINTLSEPPAAPTNIVATPVSGGKINLTWTDNATNEINYYVYYKQSSNTSYTATVGLSTNTTSYQLSGLLNNTSYDIKIKVQNGNDITYSDVVTVRTLTGAINAPTGLTATAISGSRIDLAWTDNATNEEGYIVERKNGSNFEVIATLPVNSTTYQCTGLSGCTNYTFRVKAYIGSDCSNYSSEVVQLINTAPAVPGTILGPVTACPNTTELIYSIEPIANATTYNWSLPVGWTITAGQGTNTITVTSGITGQDGNIGVTAGNSCGTSGASIKGVSVSPSKPGATGPIAGLTPVCHGITGLEYSIPSVTNASTYAWSVPLGWTIITGQGTTSITITSGLASQDGNITVTAGNSCGTSDACVKTVKVTPSVSTPVFTSGPTSLRCGNAETVSYTATAENSTAISYNLDESSLAAGNSINSATGEVTYIAGWSGTTTVTATAAGCNGSTSATHTVAIKPLPDLSFTNGSKCGSGNVQLNVSSSTSGATVSWFLDNTWKTEGESHSSFTYTYTSTQTVPVKAEKDGCANQQNATATINEIPVITPTPASRCGAGQITLTASTTSGTLKWYGESSGGDLLNSGDSYNIESLGATTTYYLEATSNEGCATAARTPLTATIKPLPVLTVSNGSRCGEGAVSLEAASASADANYNWYENGTLQHVGEPYSINLDEGETRKYTVKTILDGCESVGTDIVVTANIMPIASAYNDGPVCQNSQLHLTGKVNNSTDIASYLWTGPGDFSSPLQNPTPTLSSTGEAGTYTFAVTATNGCTNMATTEVAVKPLPGMAIAKDIYTRCGGGAFSLEATSASAEANYNWYENGTLQHVGEPYSINLDEGETRTYTVSTILDGCENNGIVTVNVSALTIPTVAITEFSRYGSGRVTLSASSEGTLKWYGEATDVAPLFTGPTFLTPAIDKTTTYYVKSEGYNFCVSELQAVAATIIQTPVVDVAHSTSYANKASDGSCNLKPAGGSLQMGLQDNSDWEIVSYPGDWMSAEATSGTGDQKAVFNVGINSGFSQRQGEIKLKSASIGDESIISVNQYYTVIKITPDVNDYLKAVVLPDQGEVMQYYLPVSSGVLHVDVETNSTWFVSIDPINTNWVHVTPQTYTGNQSITLDYEALNTISRAGEVTFTVEGSNYYLNLAQDKFVSDGRTPPLLSDHNYIYTIAPRVELDYTSQARLISDVSEAVEYFDGLGRSEQQIQISASPDKKDMVQVHDYDPLGREAKSYLGYEYNNTDNLTDLKQSHPGQYIGSAIDEQGNFYKGLFGDDESGHAFSEKIFEPSPLNRVTDVISPGADWQVKDADGNYASNNHQTRIGSYPNSSAVNRYLVDANSVTIDDFINQASLSTVSTYDANTLWITETKGENWQSGNAGITKEYVDMAGHVVLKEIYFNETETLKTYYVYDDFGRLRCVIPPKASATSAAGSEDYKKTDLCFYYAYDERGRMIEKRIPGAEPVYMVYDHLDRLVATQDGNQRAAQQWAFTKYDALSRPIMTGVINDNSSRTDMQNTVLVYSGDNLFEILGGSLEGYTNRAFPHAWIGGEITADNLLTVTYYDTYDYPGVNAYDPFAAPFLFGVSFLDNCRGLVTGTKVKVLGTGDGLTDWLINTPYYDSRGRIMQNFGNNVLGGYTVVSMKYSGITDLVIEKITKSTVDGPVTTVDQTYEYDHAGRVLHEWHKIGSNTKVMLAEYKYNSLGQVAGKGLHKPDGPTAGFLQDVTYGYNIRGWLTGINDPDKLGAAQTGKTNDDLFGMRLFYNTEERWLNDGLGQYNGNISAITWSTDPNKKGYAYSYDPLDRLTGSDYKSGNEWVDPTTAYEEKGISYDENGNITGLSRTDASGADMNVFNTYDYGGGNRLISFHDDIGSKDYSYTKSGNPAYDANGNCTYDGFRGFDITYNLLNLPQKVQKGSDYVEYVYSATGEKLARKKNGSFSKYYIGPLIYDDAKKLYSLMNEEGMVSVLTATDGTISYSYEYFLKDHLGNTRIMFDQNKNVIQQSDYYAFGLRFTGSLDNSNKYLYNGKELQDEDMSGWDVYDYGFRFYDPQTGRWHIIDPLSEYTPGISPYSYCYNNPIIYVDIAGLFGGDPTVMDPIEVTTERPIPVGFTDVGVSTIPNGPLTVAQDQTRMVPLIPNSINFVAIPDESIREMSSHTSNEGPEFEGKDFDAVLLGLLIEDIKTGLEKGSHKMYNSRTWYSLPLRRTYSTVRFNGNGRTWGRNKARTIGRGALWGQRIGGVFQMYKTLVEAQEGEIDLTRFTLDESTNLVSTWGGELGAAWGFGWEGGKIIESTQTYQTIKYRFWRFMFALRYGEPCQENELIWQVFYDSYK